MFKRTLRLVLLEILTPPQVIVSTCMLLDLFFYCNTQKSKQYGALIPSHNVANSVKYDAAGSTPDYALLLLVFSSVLLRQLERFIHNYISRHTA